MKKRIALVLSVLMMLFVLGACGTDTVTEYNGVSVSDLKQATISHAASVSTVQQLLPEIEAQGLDIKDKEFIAQMESYGITQIDIAAVEAWDAVVKEFGQCTGFDESTFKVEKSGETLTTYIKLNFENKDADFQLVYEYHSMELEGITINPIYTLGEKMTNAALNTVISMSIVFAVLILICFIISGFKIFPYLEEKKKAKTATAAPVEAVTEQVAEQPLTDDTELVAVIAAAIAASTGTSTSDFVVRSINRR